MRKVLAKRLAKHLSAFTCVLWASAFAQLSTATVLGTVQDASHANIPNANIRLINTLTGTEIDAATDKEGSFALASVLPGTYALQIERTGFATTQLSGLTLSLGDTKRLLIRMRIGAVSESVRVDASGLAVNTSDASVSTVVDHTFATGIPFEGRSFYDIVTLTPGIITQSPQAAGASSSTNGEFSVNGQQPVTNYFLVDGSPHAPKRLLPPTTQSSPVQEQHPVPLRLELLRASSRSRPWKRYVCGALNTQPSMAEHLAGNSAS